jgi:hypothetical protein
VFEEMEPGPTHLAADLAETPHKNISMGPHVLFYVLKQQMAREISATEESLHHI